MQSASNLICDLVGSVSWCCSPADHEEDRIDFHGKSDEEVESLKSARRQERREKWGRWAAAFPDDAARLSTDAEWPLQEIPDR